MKNFYRIGLTLFVCLSLVTSLFAQRTTYRLRFNSTSAEDDNAYGWNTKNNTSPLTANDEAGWVLAGGPDGYLGPQRDASTINKTLYGFLNTFGSMAGTEFLGGNYRYAVVGYSENDYDDAHVSKWLTTRVFYGIKNGDQIKFWTKQKWIGSIQTASQILAMDVGSFDCNRPNRLEVRMSVGDYSDNNEPDVGNSATSVGTFTKLLLTINPNLTVTGYPNEWTQYTATVSGLPEGKTVSGRFAFRYYFEHGGYDNCRVRNDNLPSPVTEAIGGASNIASNFGGDVGGNIGLAYNSIRLATTVFAANQKGYRGSYIALDDFEYISVGTRYVENDIEEKIWYDGKQPLGTVNFSYKGSPDCISPEVRSDSRFSYMNYTSNPVTIYVSTTNDYRENAYSIKIGQKDTNQITVLPNSGVSIRVYLKAGLPTSINGPKYESLIIRDGGANGVVLHNIKLSYEILPPAPPVLLCSQTPQQVILNDSGYAMLKNPKLFDLGSSSGECGGDLTFKFLQRSNLVDEYKLTCADGGIKEVELYAVNTKTRGSATCKVKAEVIRPNGFPSSFVQNYYTDYRGKMPLTALQVPGSNGICGVVGTPKSIIKNWNRSIDYLSTNALPVGEYQVEWEMSYAAGTPDRRNVTSTLFVIDTIKPVANCKDTVEVGFDYVGIVGKPGPIGFKLRDDINPFRDINLYSYDNSGGGITNGISKYTMYSPWYSGQSMYFADSFEIQCSNIGMSFPVTMKVADASGNFSTCQSYVKIISSTEPKCKNTTIAINPVTGIKNITTSDVLANGVGGACGMTNVALSKYSFNCSNINQTIPVSVGYTGPDSVVRGCVANVTVKSYSIPEGSCVDTVKHYLTNFSTYTTTIEPVALSACSPSLNWALTVGGTHFPSLTGGKNWSFKPGFTEVNKTAISLNDTFRCNQIYAVYDTSAPVVTAIPPNVYRTISTLNNNCKFEFEIPNPFQQGTYKEWSYTFTGATAKKVVISTSDYNYINSYWLNQWDSLNQGVTTVTLTAKDFAANETTLSYTITLNVLNPFNPSVGYFGANIPTIKGNFCGPVYNHYISSPIIAPCNQTGYMWYYEVRDAYQGTILFEQDSIPQELGAFIPLRVSAYLNHTNNNVIHFGYHEKQYGTKTFSSYSNALVQDTVSPVIVPRNETILSTNNTTFTHQYSIPSPISYAQSCSGARWGYRVTGATTLKSAENPSITYTPNQTDELSLNDFSAFYPSIPADSSPVVNLNIGLNTIEYFILEESGVTNLWANNQYKYDVTIQDASVPTFVCAPNDTLYRSSGPCNVSVANAPTQINGFTGVFGKTGFRLIGGNNKIVLNKATAPDSITFISKTGTGSNKKPAYIYVKVNTSGTVSFNWTYQCNTPQFFRPFALSDTVNPYKANPSVLSGFIQNNTGVQTGTFSKAVVAGEVLKIGVYEGGDVNGYLKISNFSAPFITTKSSISQPTYPDNAAYYLASNMDTVYPIGTNTVVYALTNLNNGQTTYCTKDIVVIDSFARSLNCQPKTLYLRANGSVELKVNDVLPSSCFPVSSTTLSKSIFTGADIGTQSVRITSVGAANDTLTCNVNITVLDTIKPTQRVAQLNIPLTPSNTATLTDSMLYEFFYDNHKIVSVTKSKTNFGCDDVGAQSIQLTATDSSGNTASITVQVQITPGFAPASERTNSIKLCSTDSITLNANAAQGYSLNYQWQIKEKNNAVKYWNYINSSDNEAFMAGTFGHQFFMMNNETYLAYFSSGSNTIEFKKLDTLTNNWRPALTALSITLSSPYTFKVFVVPGFRESLEIAHINNLPNAYGMSKLDQNTNTWNTLSDYGLPFFTYQTSGPPTTTYNGTNVNLSSLVGDNGYYFTTNNAGQIYAVNRDTIGFVRAYSRVTDTLYSFGTFYKKAYDLYKPASGVSPTRVTNGKRVLGIRNSANQNIFFELQFDAIGVISGKDSLTTDPTGGSTFFAIKSLNNLDYIAYKNAAGKAAVKVYNGSNTWSVVGAADISTNEITKVELGIVKNELHLVYVELSGRLVMKKLVGNTWIDLGSPNDNISFTTVGFELFIANLNNTPAIYFTKNNGGTPRLVALTNWRNIPNANTATYTPKIDTITTEEYKCLIGNTCGVYASSQIYKLDVTTTPKITSFSRQVNVVKYAHAQLSLNTNAANTNWQYGFANASSVLSSTNSLTLPTMLNDTVVYTYSFNGTCYSDTVKASVYVYDSSMNIYHVRVKDSICTGDDVQLSLDTALIGYQYSLYERDSTGAFESLVSSISKMADWQKVEFYVNPDTTTNYRIKVEKLAYDAAQFNTSTIYENHIDFGDDSLPSSTEITIEGWVYGIGTSPLNILGIQNVNGGINDPNSGKNWGWSGNTFDVYNGNQKRSLTFPALPYSGNWVHVATTATPSGMKIYYNGVLVASNTLASAVNINNNISHLRLGLRGENTKVSSLIGFDEFRILLVPILK